MCLICSELIRQKMTLLEAERNLGEMVNNPKESLDKLQHYARLKESIEQMDTEELDKELEKGVMDDN